MGNWRNNDKVDKLQTDIFKLELNQRLSEVTDDELIQRSLWEGENDEGEGQSNTSTWGDEQGS